MNKRKFVQLSQLVDMSSPTAILEEVKYNFIQHYPIHEFLKVRMAFRDFLDFYEGRYPGYKACNTKFHDMSHITDCLLAISRLIDGYNINHFINKLPCESVVIALIATIFHDAGYIQTVDDNEGTGAKYTLVHVKRSADFVKKYFKELGYSEKDAIAAGNMIGCTGVVPDVQTIKFQNKVEKNLGYILGTADILGQMASRTYLEKLIFLYNEFREGNVKGYTNELSLLEKTFNFYHEIQDRLKKTLNNMDRYAEYHFNKRYKIHLNMYRISIDEQMKYLKKILTTHRNEYRNMLRRKA
ncbi:MAG: hypothetical protein NT145_02840 [Elusimicrobia bacterium]|nr:hypothetical protein [Elusimicrobiota bacterium]